MIDIICKQCGMIYRTTSQRSDCPKCDHKNFYTPLTKPQIENDKMVFDRPDVTPEESPY